MKDKKHPKKKRLNAINKKKQNKRNKSPKKTLKPPSDFKQTLLNSKQKQAQIANVNPKFLKTQKAYKTSIFQLL